jgi:hypothetical protein
MPHVHFGIDGQPEKRPPRRAPQSAGELARGEPSVMFFYPPPRRFRKAVKNGHELRRLAHAGAPSLLVPTRLK